MRWSEKIRVVGTSVVFQLLDKPNGTPQSRVLKPEEVRELVESLLDAAELAMANRRLSLSELTKSSKNKSFVVSARSKK